MKKTEAREATPPKATATVLHTAAERLPETQVPEAQEKESPVELDRRGKPLPARQRVGGIITPQ